MLDLDSDSAVIVAMDHGLNWGVQPGFEDPEATLSAVLDGDPDGVLAGVPFLRRFEALLDDHPDVDRVATLDLFHESTLPGVREDAEIHRRVFGPQAAIDAGADAAKVALVYGRHAEATLETNLVETAEAAESCRERGLPLVVEPTLWGERIDDELDPTYIRNATRVAFELGADVLKCHYPGDPEAFGRIAGDAPVPVYIAGGPAADTDLAALRMVADAVGAGARGVMIGRNIWQRDDPAGMIDAVGAVVHEGVAPEAAADRLDATPDR